MRRRRRIRQGLPVLSIIGYTNAGKSTLLNAMTQSSIDTADQMFVTLEAKMKCGMGKCGRCNLGEKFVCTDGPVFSYAEVSQFLESF